ncbi:MAG: mechanosensitive ion channel family protein, partial [Thermoprotei archaeon]
VILIVLLIVILALIKLGFSHISSVRGFSGASAYEAYLDIPVTLLFAVLIVYALSDAIYWNSRLKLPHPEASSVRSVFRVIGIVAAIVATTASFISATAAAALGALAGIVVGLSTQQVLSQALAGIFLSTSRPFRVGDRVNAGAQEGVVVDVTSLFTVLDTQEARVYIPNNTVLTNVIKQYKHQKP